MFDLPRNLAWLRALESGLPAAWESALGGGPKDGVKSGEAGLQRVRAGRVLHRAREARAWERVERFVGAAAAGASPAERPAELGELTDYRNALATDFADDPERLEFERSITFEAQREAGVLALSQGAGRAALAPLLDAIDLRPERADLYLFLALALERTGDRRNASNAASKALELCPRILETPQGVAAQRLGLQLRAAP